MTDDVFVVETSFAQRSIWMANQFAPDLPTYNVTAVVRIRGPLRPELLERSLNAVIDRHESLRTVFRAEEGRPVQVVRARMPVPVPVVDITESDLPGCVAADTRRPFDLARGPLLAMRLLRVAPDEHVAVLVMHHIVTDGWSSAVLFRELSACYEAFTGGREPELPELPIQYADYAVWQRETLQGPHLRQLVDYWTGQLAGLPPLRLPIDRPRPALRTEGGDVVEFRLPGALVDDLQRLGRAHGATLFMVLLAAYGALLGRYSGQRDFAIASPVANRGRPEIEPLIGYFVNMLVLRIELGGEPSFADLLGRVRSVCTGAMRHQDLPFETVVEKLRPPRYDGVGSALAQVMFVLQNTGEAFGSAGLTFEPVNTPTGTAKAELSLIVEPGPDGHLATLEYSTDVFERAGMERFAELLLALLGEVVADPHAAVAHLPSAPARPPVPPRPDAGAPPLPRIAEQARRNPDAAAVIGDSGRTSYREVMARAAELAGRIRSVVPPETPVPVLLRPGAEVVVAYLAVLQAGAAVLPVDTATPPSRIFHLLSEVNAPYAVVAPDLTDLLAGVATVPLPDEPAPDGQPVAVPDGALAWLEWTERPGAPIVLGTRATLTARVNALGRAGDRVPIGHTLSSVRAVATVLAALAHGSTVVLPPGGPASDGRGPDTGGFDVRLLDDGGYPVPDGIPGELCLAGDAVPRGYWRRAALTARRFVPDPSAGCPGARLQRTGRLARRRADGELQLLGERDRTIMLNGLPVRPEEVEGLLREHPDVADAVVTALPDGGGLAAWAQAGAGERPSGRALRDHLATRLPEVMVPRYVTVLDELPRDQFGDVVTAALPPVDVPAPDAPVTPRTPLELELAGLLTELPDPTAVDVTRTFIDLGGHSLLAVKVLARITAAYGVEVPLRTLYSCTVEELADVVTDLTAHLPPGDRPDARVDIPVLARVPGENRFPASPSQEGMWAEAHDPAEPAPIILAGLRLRGPLDVPVLTTALRSLMRRHETLRSALRMVDGKLTQVVAPVPPPVTIEITDAAPEDFPRITWAEVDTPIDLDSGPLFRLRLLRFGAEDHAVLLILHHLVGDARGLQVFIRDLTAFYLAGVAGVDPQLPDLRIQYADFAQWYRERLDGPRGEELLRYWQRRLEGATPAEVPADLDRRSTSIRGDTLYVPLDDQLLDDVAKLGARHGATLFMVACAAFQVLLARYSGQRDIAVRVPISYRDWLAVDDLVADFSNDVVVRGDLSADPTFTTLVEQIRDTTVEDFSHQELPPGLLLSRMPDPELLGRLFEVQFAAEDSPRVDLPPGPLSAEPMTPPWQYAYRPLAVRLRYAESGSFCIATYRTAVFSAGRVTDLVHDYLDLLGWLVANPGRRVLGDAGPRLRIDGTGS